jgi:hypothetical protein
METALEILARIGGDNPPTLAELTSARDTIARELHAVKKSGNADLAALTSVREAWTVANAAVEEATKAEEEAAKELESALDGIPDPDATIVVEDPEPDAPRVMNVQEAVEKLGLVAQPRVEVNEPEPVDSLASVAHEVRIGNDIRDDATWRDLAEAFAAAGGSLKRGKENVARITSEFDPGRTLSRNIEADTRLVDSFMSVDAVKSAGGCCSLPTPIYENPVFGSLSRPIRDSLNTLGVQGRGAVTFFPAICLPDSGADIWTCADDEAVDPEDPETWKDCLAVECDAPETAEVDGIYTCLTVGNFQQRFATEQWEGIIRAVSVRQARIAEVNLFTKMREAVSTTHTAVAYGSTYVNLINAVGLAASAIRQDQRLDDSVMLHLWVPSWLRSAIYADLRVNALNTGRDSVEATEQVIAQALANEGVNVTYSPDVDDIETQQYDGPLTEYPSEASAVLAPEGFFTFLDGGQFDLGTDIRDHEQNRQNALAAFAESFEGLLARGCNAKALDIPVEACDNVACPA